MGYRSDVGLCLTKTGVEELNTRLAALESLLHVPCAVHCL